MEYLLVPFHYEYMRYAFWVGIMVSITCGMLSCFITLKGWSLMGDALSHSVVPGVAIAYYWHWPFSIGAFLTGMIAALGMSFVKMKTNLKEDVVTGVVFTSFFALGVFLISLNPEGVQLQTIVLGNILSLDVTDLYQVSIICSLCILVLILKWKDIFLVSFDPIFAKSLGLNVNILQILLLTLLSAAAVACLQAVGACLVVAMLVTPGASAFLLTQNFGKMLIFSIIISVISAFFGIYLSYFIDGATGACVVVLQTIIFAIIYFYKRMRREAA